MLLRLADITWRTDPYRIGLVQPVMDEAAYQELVALYPPESAFLSMGKGYNKLALSERCHPHQYLAFIEGSRPWQEFYRCIKSAAFVQAVRAAAGLEVGAYSSRFEFSSLPAAGGGLDPHTDIPSKVVTLIVPMLRSAGDWDARWGGGTDVLRPLDPTKRLVDYRAPLSEFEKVASYEYGPNQCVVFVKTAHSWHSVGPLTGPAGQWRRTVTINIERAQ